jgi:4-alpha-glucanotransferase
MSVDEGLLDWARRSGVATEYWDFRGVKHEVSDVALRAVLSAAGEPVEHVHVNAGRLPELESRMWGWQAQLYQLRGADSWGIGDLGDLHDLVVGMAAHGADLLLVNPLHAITPVAPIAHSPYYPSSRRFTDQVSVSVTSLLEYRSAPASLRAEVDALRPPSGPLIDRQSIWAAKLAAFELLVPAEYEISGQPDPVQLREFGVFCALAEKHGRRWRDWPESLRHPGPAADEAADPARVWLHVWIQIAARGQLLDAQAAARKAGMRIGIVHDLAVGIDPEGADGWLLSDFIAPGCSVGAPPDALNEIGQDWGLPTFRRDRLAEANFAPWKDVVAAASRYGGGLRIDHVMGLCRLWWVPAGLGAVNGTYVQGNGAAMLAAVVEVAREHNCVVIGEDLGTVDPDFQWAMGEAGVLGTAVLYFQQDHIGAIVPPEHWRHNVVATVTTHDLPTARAFLRGEHVDLREMAGVLGLPIEEARALAAVEREAVLAMLRNIGLIGSHTGEDAIVEAMHVALCRSPSRLVLAAVADAVGDLRQPNLPGTLDEYDNWRLPLTDVNGAEVSVTDFLAAAGTISLASKMTEELRLHP